MSFAERARNGTVAISQVEWIFRHCQYPLIQIALANGTQAQAQPANPSIFTSANSDPYNYVSIPDKEASVLIQRSGQQWRVIRNGVIITVERRLAVGDCLLRSRCRVHD